MTTTLQDAAGSCGVLFGTAADASEFGHSSPLVNDPAYASLVRQQFGIIVPENAGKLYVTNPNSATTYNWAPLDEIVAFAGANGQKMRFHNALWRSYNPPWLAALAAAGNKPGIKAAMLARIDALTSRYRGQFHAVDVWNEVLADSCSGKMGEVDLMYGSIWHDAPGTGDDPLQAVAECFTRWRAADPAAQLGFNDYGCEALGSKLINAASLVQYLQSNACIDYVGLECHADLSGAITPQSVRTAVATLTSLGVDVRITELDVRLPVDANGNASASDLAKQADFYAEIAAIALDNPRLVEICTWGVGPHSWIPGNFPGMGAATLFDGGCAPKPAVAQVVEQFNAASRTTLSIGNALDSIDAVGWTPPFYVLNVGELNREVSKGVDSNGITIGYIHHAQQFSVSATSNAGSFNGRLHGLQRTMPHPADPHPHRRTTAAWGRGGG